jgi:hypothetical protein
MKNKIAETYTIFNKRYEAYLEELFKDIEIEENHIKNGKMHHVESRNRSKKDVATDRRDRELNDDDDDIFDRSGYEKYKAHRKRNEDAIKDSENDKNIKKEQKVKKIVKEMISEKIEK